MNRSGYIGIVASTVLAVSMTFGWAVPAGAQATKLVMVGSWPPKVSAAADMGIQFLKEVNKRGKGKIEIEFRGSREVVPTFDQPEALVKGIFDIWYGAQNYWAGVVPAGYLTELSPYEIGDNGPGSELWNFMVKLYEKKGIRYLGHLSGDPQTGSHFMYTQKPVKSINDLKGRKIRVPPLTRFLVKAIGAEPVTLPPPEIYVALERGTVEGFTWPYYDGFTNFGWQEVTKYIINHPLYRDGIGLAMNLKKWNSLTKEQQDILHAAVRRTQIWSLGWVAAHQQKQLEAMTKAGMKVITFSKAEAALWQKTARDALWANFKTVMSPDEFATAQRLMGVK